MTVGVRLDEEAEVAQAPETSVWTASASLAPAPAPACVTTTSTTSASSREIGEEGEVGGTHVRAREVPARLTVVRGDDSHIDCVDFRAHPNAHVYSALLGRQSCAICHPEDYP